ncbi:MAG TPA: UDP-glucose/GDP-mannose dehydrogenase family protein [Acidimicrobiales bacterium]|nr:UDP-glucose/GDP-mannose dehydrogenase family protein [Acidimicrobiales bacterium]
MKIGVLGAGYVGLTTAACLAHLGHDVTCADVVPDKVDRLADGDIPIVEEGLPELVRDGLDSGRLRFVLGEVAAVTDAEFVFLCVPTPQGDDGSADMSYIEKAAEAIGPHLDTDTIVVNKSTVPVGSTRVVERALGRSDIAVVSNPEFLREGTAVHDFLHPDRIVVGSEDNEAAIRMTELFAGIKAPFVVTDPPTAETIKYASNAFLATKVSFINAVANLCEAVGANVREVVLGMGYDKRIGFEFLRPGPGWGGSCFPKDTHALVHIGEEAGYDFELLRGVIAVNEEQYERVAAKVRRMAGGDLEGRRIAVWGLTFKARTDDRRDSPAISVIRRLLAAGATVTGYDPTVRATMPEAPEVHIATDPYDACADAEVLVVLTEWDEFRWLDLGQVRMRMAAARIVDARNLLEPAGARRAGFAYEGVGFA